MHMPFHYKSVLVLGLKGLKNNTLWGVTPKTSAVFTGHLMIDRLPPPPLPCDASFLKSKSKWNCLFKGLESPLISLCYEISGLISALSNSENRF